MVTLPAHICSTQPQWVNNKHNAWLIMAIPDYGLCKCGLMGIEIDRYIPDVLYKGNIQRVCVIDYIHDSEGWGFESPSGRDIFCLKNFDTFTRTPVHVSKMNAVAHTQLAFQMLTLLKKYHHLVSKVCIHTPPTCHVYEYNACSPCGDMWSLALTHCLLLQRTS